MKRLLVLLFIIALCACRAGAQAPSDVPKDHWAYDAVTSLIDKGYMIGYPDGSFMANRTLTRYEFATVVKRIIDGISERAVKQVSEEAPKANPPTEAPKPQVTAEDMAALQKLIDEFKPELAVIGARIDKIEAALSDIKSTVETVKTDVSKLKKVTVSGYVQARYNTFQADPNSATAAAPPANFSIRRARVKVTAKPTSKSTVVYQLDGGQNYTGATPPAITTKDAYLEYDFAGGPTLGPGMLFGQMTWPYGYEVVQGDTSRESPERSLIVQRLFPGERDRGFYVSWPFNNAKYVWKIGAFNGVQANQTPPTDAKAMVTSLRTRFGDLECGVSGWYGGRVTDSAGAWYGQASEPKTRFGADVEWYLNGLSLKAEYVQGVGVDGSSPITAAKPFNPLAVSQTCQGGWAQAAWNFTKADTLAVKYETMSHDPLYPAFGRRSAWDLGVLHWLDEKTRVKLYYIINQEESNPFPNNALIGEWITVF